MFKPVNMPKSKGFKLVGTETEVNQALTKISDDCEYCCVMKKEEEYVLMISWLIQLKTWIKKWHG